LAALVSLPLRDMALDVDAVRMPGEAEERLGLDFLHDRLIRGMTPRSAVG
jgi:hypothetical protein